jgi:ABC-type sugar transport system permease subunit
VVSPENKALNPSNKYLPVNSREYSSLGQWINRRIYWFLLFPSFVFYTVFSTLPMLMAIGIGFTEWSGISINTIKWIGLGNYIELFSDRFFWISLRNNIVIVGGSVLIQCTIALLIAVILDSGLRGAELFRTVFFMPTVLSFIVVGLLFSLLLSPTVGIVNPLLIRLGLSSWQHQWLGDKQTALYTVMIVNIWKEFGFSVFLFLAGLQNISKELYEAAWVDGAGPWKNLWYITIPLLREVTIVVVILAVNQAFLVFDLIYVMTSGGPYHASEVLATYMYSRAFTSGRMGYGTAIAEVLFVIVFIITLIQLRVTRAGKTEY